MVGGGWWGSRRTKRWNCTFDQRLRQLSSNELQLEKVTGANRSSFGASLGNQLVNCPPPSLPPAKLQAGCFQEGKKGSGWRRRQEIPIHSQWRGQESGQGGALGGEMEEDKGGGGVGQGGGQKGGRGGGQWPRRRITTQTAGDPNPQPSINFSSQRSLVWTLAHAMFQTSNVQMT